MVASVAIAYVVIDRLLVCFPLWFVSLLAIEMVFGRPMTFRRAIFLILVCVLSANSLVMRSFNVSYIVPGAGGFSRKSDSLYIMRVDNCPMIVMYRFLSMEIC